MIAKAGVIVQSAPASIAAARGFEVSGALNRIACGRGIVVFERLPRFVGRGSRKRRDSIAHGFAATVEQARALSSASSIVPTSFRASAASIARSFSRSFSVGIGAVGGHPK